MLVRTVAELQQMLKERRKAIADSLEKPLAAAAAAEELQAGAEEEQLPLTEQLTTEQQPHPLAVLSRCPSLRSGTRSTKGAKTPTRPLSHADRRALAMGRAGCAPRARRREGGRLRAERCVATPADSAAAVIRRGQAY